MFELSARWGEFFKKQPETGMGYWICSAIMKDDRTFDRVVITGGIVSSVNGSRDIPFSENEISQFVITHDKSALTNNVK